MARESPVAVVTGAGSGVGRAVCEMLANAGVRIALVGRTEKSLAKTMDIIAARSAAPPDMTVAPADVGDAAQARSVIDLTMAQWGRVDVLVNNAGEAPREEIEATDADLLYRVFAVSAFGPAHLIARAWPVFRKQRGGRIVNVSSLATSDPFPGFFVYAAAKSALESLARSAAKEGAAFGVRAFNVALGAVETPMLRRLFSERELPLAQTLDPLDAAAVIRDCALGRRDDESGRTIAVERGE